MVLHVHSTDAGTISEALQSFIQQKQLDLRKLLAKDMMMLLNMLGRLEFINEFRPCLFMQSTFTIVVTSYSSQLISGSCISEGNKDVF